MKQNPLFIDSTKIQGDSIKVQFELKNLLLYDGETLHLKLYEAPQKQLHERQMEYEDKFWTTKIFLRHKNQILFQYFIKKGDRVLFQSPVHQQLSCYVVESLWEPDFQESSLDQELEKHLQDSRAFHPYSLAKSASRMDDPKLSLGGLVKKWGF